LSIDLTQEKIEKNAKECREYNMMLHTELEEYVKNHNSLLQSTKQSQIQNKLHPLLQNANLASESTESPLKSKFVFENDLLTLQNQFSHLKPF
jgi:ATP-dependent helicase/DNAse subunit B